MFNLIPESLQTLILVVFDSMLRFVIFLCATEVESNCRTSGQLDPYETVPDLNEFLNPLLPTDFIPNGKRFVFKHVFLRIDSVRCYLCLLAC